MRRRLRRSEHQDPRHPQQPDPQRMLTPPHTPDCSSSHCQCAFAHPFAFVRCAVATDLADERRPALLPDPGHGGRMGRSPFRREADAYAIAILKPPIPTTCSFAQLTPCVHPRAERVPYEGTSRMQTSLRRRQRDRVVRRSVLLPSNPVSKSQPLPKRAPTDRV